MAASATHIPKELVELLNVGGKIVIPIENTCGGQVLMVGTKTPHGEVETKSLGGVRFVPLI